MTVFELITYLGAFDHNDQVVLTVDDYLGPCVILQDAFLEADNAEYERNRRGECGGCDDDECDAHDHAFDMSQF